MPNYTYVNTLGQTQTIDAANPQEAIRLAPNRRPDAGVFITPNQTITQNGIPMVDTNVLTQNGNQPQVPNLTPTQTPQAFVQGLTPVTSPTLPGVNPAAPGAVSATTGQLGTLEGQRGALINRLSQAQQQLLGKGAEQLRLEQQQGISGINQELQGLNEEFANKQAGFMRAAENFRSGQVGTQELSTGKIAQIERNKAVELGGLSIQIMAKQGKLDSAKAEVDRVLALEFDPIKQEIENTKTFIDLNYQDLTRVEKRQADALKIQLDRQDKAMDRAIADRKYNTDLALALSKDGKLSSALFNDVISGKKTVSQAAGEMAIANGVDPIVESQARSVIDTIDSALTNKQGLRSLVGPNSIFSRSQGNIFSLGSQQKFASAIHKITGQLTLNNLINAKANGATFGALSEGELALLSAAATQLTDWEVKDKNGRPTGAWAAPETAVREELNKIRDYAKLDYQRRTGQLFIEPLEDKTETDFLNSVPLSNTALTNGQFFQ